MVAALYCLRGDLADEMQLTDPNEDTRLDRAITDASRAIDAFCNQLPGAFAAQTLTRLFDVNGRYLAGAYPRMIQSPSWGYTEQSLYVPPLISLSALKSDEDGDGVYETTWTANADYLLWPRNTEVKRRIDRNVVTGRYFLPPGQARIQAVGSWGFLEDGLTPYPIRRACLLLSMIYYRRPSNAPTSQGLGGAAARIGYTDMDVAAILWEVSGKYRERAPFG